MRKLDDTIARPSFGADYERFYAADGRRIRGEVEVEDPDGLRPVAIAIAIALAVALLIGLARRSPTPDAVPQMSGDWLAWLRVGVVVLIFLAGGKALEALDELLARTGEMLRAAAVFALWAGVVLMLGWFLVRLA